MSPIFPIATLDPRFRLYTATDGQIEFAVPFPWQNNQDIVVWRFDLEGDQFVLNEAEHYQLTGAGSPTGGTMTLVEGVEALEGEQFLILGDVQLTRAGSIVQGGRFRSRSTDDDLDRMILIAQEVQRELGRTLRTAYGVSGAEVDVGDDNVLPVWRSGRLEAGPVWGEELGTIAGPGVAAGGTTDQVLAKASGIDFDTEWISLGTAASRDTGLAAGNVPMLDGSGLLDVSVLPALAITETFVVASQVAMLALSAQRGDFAIRSDLNKCYVLSTDSPATLADWKELLTPTDLVLSVAGLTGAISIAALVAAITALRYDQEDQTISGGARVTVKNLGNLSGASITPDPGDRPIQKITNNGAGSILPGSNEGQYTLQVINASGAGAITTTGWTLRGHAFDTTTSSKFLCSCLVTADIKAMTIVKVA
jgi:hypothetical protein